MHRSSVQVEFVLADSTYERPANDCSTHFDPAVRSYDLPIHSTVGDWWWRSIPCTEPFSSTLRVNFGQMRFIIKSFANIDRNDVFSS